MGGGAGTALGAAVGPAGAPGPMGPAAVADSGTRRALAAMTVKVLKLSVLDKLGALGLALRSERRGS